MKNMKSFWYKLFLSSTIFIVSILTLQNSVHAYGVNEFPAYRISGADRYETSSAVCREWWTTSEYIVVVSGEEAGVSPCIFGAAPLAYTLGAPVLLTLRDSLPLCIHDEIVRLNAKKAILVGNENMISPDVASQLEGMGISVERLWSDNRDQTAVIIGERIRTVSKSSKVVLVPKVQPEYAALAAPYSCKSQAPMLITQKDGLSITAIEALREWKIESADIIGDTNIISPPVEEELRSLGIEVNRIDGSSLIEINLGMIEAYKSQTRYLAAARDYYDILCGSPGAAIEGCDFAIINENTPEFPVMLKYLRAYNSERLFLFGGIGALPDNIIFSLRYSTTGEAADGNISVNINNNSFIDAEDGWTYYSNPDDGGRLYKSRADESESIKICDDQSLNINIWGRWIYYINLSDNSRIYKIKTDGTCRTILNDTPGENMVLADNWIYYYSSFCEPGIYKMATDGTSSMKLFGVDASNITAAGDWIYYINNSDKGSIYRIKKTDGSSMEKLLGVHTNSFNISDGSIYYSNPDGSRSAVTVSIGWVQVVKPTVPSEKTDNTASNCIAVKDAFNNDGVKTAFLTFDDGPSKKITPQILDILKKYNIKATFFIVGKMAANYVDIVKRINDEGHSIANHSYSHSYNYIYSSTGNFINEINAWERVIKSILGEGFTSKLFRFPGGSFGNKHEPLKQALRRRGYEYINWNALTGDSEGNNIAAESLIKRLKESAAGEEDIVILMHDLGNKGTTVESLPPIIEHLKSQGYEFKSLR